MSTLIRKAVLAPLLGVLLMTVAPAPANAVVGELAAAAQGQQVVGTNVGVVSAEAAVILRDGARAFILASCEMAAVGTEAHLAELGCWIEDLDSGTVYLVDTHVRRTSGPGFSQESRIGEIPVNGTHDHELCVLLILNGVTAPYCSPFLP